jgi:hypothetical protein
MILTEYIAGAFFPVTGTLLPSGIWMIIQHELKRFQDED